MASPCCEFTGPLLVGDTVPIITISAGTGGDVSGIFIQAEGCDCSYSDTYADMYCDVTEGGTYPNGRITDTEYEVLNIPAGHELVIDAVARTVRILESGTNNQVGGLDALAWEGLFEWIEAAKGGCQRVCIDSTTASVNADTTASVVTRDREL